MITIDNPKIKILLVHLNCDFIPCSIPAINATPTADISGEGIRITDLSVRSAINCITKSLFDIPPSHLKEDYSKTI